MHGMQATFSFGLHAPTRPFKRALLTLLSQLHCPSFQRNTMYPASFEEYGPRLHLHTLQKNCSNSRINRRITTPTLYTLVIGEDFGMPRAYYLHHSQLTTAPEILMDKLQCAVYLTGEETPAVVVLRFPHHDAKAWHDLLYFFTQGFQLPGGSAFTTLMSDWLLGAEFQFPKFQDAALAQLKEKSGLEVYADMDEEVVREAFKEEMGYGKLQQVVVDKFVEAHLAGAVGVRWGVFYAIDGFTEQLLEAHKRAVMAGG